MERCKNCGSAVEFSRFEHVIDIDGNSVDIVICPNCSILHNTYLDRMQISEHMAEQFQASAVQNVYKISQEDMKLIRPRVNESVPILMFLFEQSDISVARDVYLEVGTGAGYLAAAAARFFSKVFATEFDTRETEKTFQAMELRNATVLRSMTEFDATGEKADLVVLWHTLEHIPEPLEFLSQVRRRMTPNGVIYFQVPLYRKPNLCPSHLWFFNERAVRVLRKKLGFAYDKIIFDTANDFMSVVFY